MNHRIARHCAVVVLLAAGGASTFTTPAHAVGDKDCGDFDSQRAAQIFFLNHGGPDSDPHRLDSDGDGIACESNPAPYYYGTTLPDQPSSEPKPAKVKSTVKLALSRKSAIAGEKVRLVATVKPQSKRTVVFQRRSSGKWRAVDRDVTNQRGRAAYALRAPKSDVTYRAVVLKKKADGKILLGDASDRRRLNAQHQEATLELSQNVAEESSALTARVVATPARFRRQVTLQVLRDGSWEAIQTGRENRDGVETFSLPTLSVDDYRLRAVVGRWRGAAAISTDIEDLSVQDWTSPSAPTGLMATSGDGSVSLAWTPPTDPDVEYYSVLMRTTGSAQWTTVGYPAEAQFVVDTLTNGSSYDFAVMAVDTHGNHSTASTVVQSTPTSP